MALSSSSAVNDNAVALLIDIPSGILCGIDLLSFTTSPHFCGIKDIPPGWHFIFSSETASLSIRDGFWFHIAPISSSSSSSLSPLVVRKWDPAAGCLRPCNDPVGSLDQLPLPWKNNLTPYRQSASKDVAPAAGTWPSLTEHITSRLLSHLTQNEAWDITSASCARQDRDEIPGLSAEEMGTEERQLGDLGINLKRTWREGAVGRERTEAAVDRSWALSDIVEKIQSGDGEGGGGKWGDAVLGQMEACFLMVLTIANYSCLEEWKRCLKLVLTCKRAVRERQGWFCTFLVVLKKQIERCEDVEGGLFDMSDEGGGSLKHLLKNFRRTLGQVFENGEGDEVKEDMEALEALLKSEYGWELGNDFVRKGMLDLEDGERVEMETEEMDGDDERGEYAPVVVDLDAP